MIGFSYPPPFPDELPLEIEDLDAIVPGVGHYRHLFRSP